MHQYKKLTIWKRAIALATQIYEVTSTFPTEEKYGLTSQLRRCVISIGSNIAEGAGRNSNNDFIRFLNIAYASTCELETQLIIAKNLSFIDKSISAKLSSEITELQKMIYSFTEKLKK